MSELKECRINKTRYDLFIEKVVMSCWNWIGGALPKGYGQFWDGTRSIVAHWFLLPEYPEPLSKGTKYET